MLFRLIWAADMEWKTDEKVMFQKAAEYAQSGRFPDTGLKSGSGLVNSGFSMLPFILFYKICPDPVCMVRFVMWLNVAALLFMFYLAGREKEHRETLTSGVALMAVNVLCVIFSRKIWAQDLLPVFIAAFWWLQTIRQRKAAYLFTGILAAFAGQLHISGFFTGAGIFLVSLWLKPDERKAALWFVPGFVLAMLPALPWILAVMQSGETSDVHFSHIFRFEFFLHALTDPTGLNVWYSLGRDEWGGFLKMPLFSGRPVYLAAIATILLSGTILFTLFRGFGKNGWKYFHVASELRFYVLAFVLLPGILLTLSGTPVRSHYLIGMAPFLQAYFASVWIKSGRKYFYAIAILQAVVSFLFLLYVHESTEISGDYGVPFRRQF